jgi:sugar-specific transcriptional regulator TrmB
MTVDPAAALATMGFTQLESLIYCELLRNAPATGYRLSQLVGKAPANIYQVLKALTQKGAIVASNDREEATSYIPVPPEQLLAGIRHGFEERYDAALAALESVHAPTTDETVYQLRTVAQVMERTRAMLSDAKEVVILDFFPALYDVMREEVDAARARGVLVAGIAYRPEDEQPTMPYNGEAADLVEIRWPGLGLILVVDGCQQLIAQLSKDMTQVLNAVYTDSVFLSCVFHSAVAADIRLVALRKDPSDPLKILSLQRSTPPGLRTMLGLETKK